MTGIMPKGFESCDIEEAVAVRFNGGCYADPAMRFGAVGGTPKFGVCCSNGEGTGSFLGAGADRSALLRE